MNIFAHFKRATTIYIVVYLSVNCLCYGQIELKKIIPLSPNAAEMSKYIDSPVNYFSGIPSINFALFDINSGNLSMPISLSYHGGGNKVESIASWVGLSWSITGMPCISRSVNGLPDESAGGFFFARYLGLTCDEIYSLKSGSDQDQTNYDNYIKAIEAGEIDSEPDIFSYSINGESGKFYYNQKLNKFVTCPLTNTVIKYESGSFTIIREDGSVYYFGAMDRELSKVSNPAESDFITNSWAITNITDYSQNHTISFTYETEPTSNKFLGSDIKYIYCDGQMNFGKEYTGIAIKTLWQRNKRLSKISFDGGYIHFQKGNIREDLSGSYSLDKISLYNNSGEQVKEFSFQQKYISGTGTNELGLNKWMLLKSFKEKDLTSSISKVYSFEYDESQIPPSRISLAQDYWGFYNGKTSNATLIPSTIINSFNSINLYIAGADRYTDTIFSNFCILKKIIFPTGGYREFTFENNEVDNNELPPKFNKNCASIEAANLEDLNPEYPVHKEYQTEFCINNPSIKLLNDNNTKGGSYVNVEIDGTGVDEGAAGAKISIKGISDPSISIGVTSSFNGKYLPNGAYKIIAVFDQNPPNYQNFFVRLTWFSIDSTVQNKYAGGLRIKEIRTFPSKIEYPIKQKFRYTSSLYSTKSSGDIFSKQDYNKYDIVDIYNSNGDLVLLTHTKYFRLTSTGNQQQITTSGSYVGYKMVFVESDEPNKIGYESYEYTHMKDQEQYSHAPYPPVLNHESFRGQLKRHSIYKKVNNYYYLTEETENKYSDLEMDSCINYGIKLDPDDTYLIVGPSNTLHQNVLYSGITTWSALSSSVHRIYTSGNDSSFTETKEYYLYNDKYRHVAKKSSIDSKNNAIDQSFNYLYNTTMANVTDDSIKSWAKQHNVLNFYDKIDNSKNGILLSRTQYRYNIFGSDSNIQISSIKKLNNNSEEIANVVFSRYDSKSNLLEQQNNYGINYIYIWGYNKEYPIVKMEGANFDQVKSALGFTSDTELEALSATLLPDVNSIRTQLDNYFKNSPVQITTYTYRPLVGMLTATDPKGVTTFYEYDTFNRLKRTYIKENNVEKTVQTYDYHYKQ